jgi:hypothetical protein
MDRLDSSYQDSRDWWFGPFSGAAINILYKHYSILITSHFFSYFRFYRLYSSTNLGASVSLSTLI